MSKFIRSLEDIRDIYDNCDADKCKDCPLNHYIDLIPMEFNEGERVRGTVCDIITTMNNYYVRKITQMLH